MTARLDVYRTRGPFVRRNQRWRWRLIATNGKKLANGGEGYANRAYCINQAKAVLSGSYAFTADEP